MITLYTLTPTMSVISFWISMALALVSIYCVIHASTSFVPKYIIPHVIGFLVDLVFYLVTYDCASAISGYGELRFGLAKSYASMAPVSRVVLIIALMLFTLFRFARVQMLRKSVITQFSVGDAISQMPIGVVFYGRNGFVLQSNNVMDNLCYELTGKGMLNGETYWSEIQSGDFIEDVEFTPGKNPVITLENGTTYMFREADMPSDLGPLKQLYAINVTAEQSMIRELTEENEKLREMNKRLKAYNTMVDDTVKREELLAAKMRVHDEMGEALLSARMFIEYKKAPVTGEQVYSKWNQTMDLLMHESAMEDRQGEPDSHEVAMEQVERLMKAAQHLGIDLDIIGEMPEDFDIMKLVCVGIQECMTNAIQHAEATWMKVEIEEEKYEYKVTYSNDGNPVTLPIKEGGGLSLFRQSAEKYCGTIEYVDAGQFKMVLTVPKDQMGGVGTLAK